VTLFRLSLTNDRIIAGDIEQAKAVSRFGGKSAKYQATSSEFKFKFKFEITY
jgi:hypothetical protein